MVTQFNRTVFGRKVSSESLWMVAILITAIVCLTQLSGLVSGTCYTNINCGAHGNCSGYSCECESGWIGPFCEYQCDASVCNGHGSCNPSYYGTYNTICNCDKGYGGNNCSQKYSCSSLNNCSGHGYCANDNYCSCDSDWTSANCSLPITCTNVNNCSGNGYCSGYQTCSCNLGWQGADCNIQKVANCSALNNCSGRGDCFSGFPNDYCSCYSRYYGYSCENTYNCSSLNNCNGHGDCTMNNYCSCNSGFGGSDCSKKPNCSSLNNCSGHGFCSLDNYCICDLNYGNADCSAYSAPTCYAVKNCSNHGWCTGTNVCTCYPGYDGLTCSEYDCRNVSDCSGHGSCVGVNTCSCMSGWRGNAACSAYSCDATNNCTGLGSCIGPNQCSGNPSIKCFDVISTSSSVCSGRGTCIGTDTCKCITGAFGTNCNSYAVAPTSLFVINSVNFKSVISIPVTLIGPNSYSFKWKQTGGSPSLQLSSITVGGIVNGPGLYINSNTDTFDNGMVAGETYTFQVNITRDDGFFTVLESSVKVGLTPILKATIVNPSDNSQSGVAVTTKFTATVQQATDPNDSQASLMFGYGFYTETGSKVVSSYTSSSQVNLTLPYQSSGQVTAFVYVINVATGNQKEVKFTMAVTNPVSGKTASEVNSFVQNLVTQDASISQLSIAVELLSSSSSSTDSAVIQQRTEIKQQVINSIISKTATTSAERDSLMSVLVAATGSANEVSTTSVTKTLEFLAAQPSLGQNFNPAQLGQLASQILSCSVFNSTSSSYSTASKQVRTIIDAALTATASNLAAGQSAVKTFGNIVAVVASNTLDSLQATIPSNSISSVGLKSISLPTASLQSLFSKSGIPTSTLVSLSLSTAPTSMYSFTQTSLASTLARIALINSNSASTISVANLTSPIEFNLQVGNIASGKKPICKYFNEVTNSFTTDGIETVVISATEIKCRVSHLTDFAIVPEASITPTTTGSVVKPQTTIARASSMSVTIATLIVAICSIVFMI